MNNNSYSLPPLVSQTISVDKSSSGQTTITTNTVKQTNVPSLSFPGLGTKEYILGGVILLVLAVLFFFAAQQFSNHLVKKRHKPSNANTASIWLFFLLFDLAVIAVIGILDAGLLSLLQISIPLAILALVFVVLLILSVRR
jgi:hypothetical protein